MKPSVLVIPGLRPGRQQPMLSAQLLVLLMACFSAASAQAAEQLVLQLETSLGSDSNPFRFYDNQPDSQGNPVQRQTDTVQGNDLRAGLIVPLASEGTRLLLTGSLGSRMYKEYRQLDHDEYAGDAVLQLQQGQWLNGDIRAGAGQHLFQYINGSLTQKDIAHEQHYGADLAITVANQWRVLPQLYQNQLRYDLPVNQLYNNQEHGVQLGLQYFSPTGSSAGVGWRRSNTDYPDRSPDQISLLGKSYRENEAYLDAEWHYSIKTATSLHLGYIRRDYPELEQRNTRFYNAIWRGVYYYSPQLRLDLQLFDRPFNIVDPTILYVVTRGVRTDLSWDWSDKTRLNASALLQKNDQQLVVSQNGATQNEKLQRFGLGFSYKIERGFRLFADSFFEKTVRDISNLTLRQNVIRVGLEYTFENIPGSAAKMGLNRYKQSLSATEAAKDE